MSEIKFPELLSLKALLRALLFWLLSALVLLPLACLIVGKSHLGSDSLGYISSALSFLCAFFSALLSGIGEGDALIGRALIKSGAICLLLLSAGCIIKGDIPESSGVLSLVSFTCTGCLLGAVMSPQPKSSPKKRKNKFKL